MGIEPFTPPRRELQPRNRDEKVLRLAKLLHQRGLTVSLTDAKRLAEGMVDVEKKVIAQAPTIQNGPPVSVRPVTPRTERALVLNLPEEFAKFVATAAALMHEDTHRSITVAPRPMVSYGREERRGIPEVPHAAAHRQIFFDDAPPLTQARGFSGKQPSPVTFESQRASTKVTRVEVAPGAVATMTVTTTPHKESVEERVVIEENPTDIPGETPAPTTAPDGAVDLFSIFKKK
jgi:hypothetical protein